MYFWIISVAIGLILLILFLYFRVQKKYVIALIFKAMTSVMFIATALLSWFFGGIKENGFGLFIVLDLSFGLLGDIWLDLKYAQPEYSEAYTHAGFISFGLGHLFGLLGLFLFMINWNDNPLYIIIPIILAILMSFGNLLLEKPLQLKYKKMKVDVVIYGCVLFMTLLFMGSIALQYNFKNITLIIIFIGLVLFTLSDLVLNGTYFGQNKDKPVHIIVNHVLYYVGQFIIAAALFFT